MTDSVETADWIVFDDVQIDVAGRRLLVAGAEAALEPKAFAVLLLLVGRAGRVVTRDEILDAVWGHRHVTPGVLNRIVTLLRQALGETARESQYVSTLHGVGYRFDAHPQFSSQRAHLEERQATTEAVPAAPVPEAMSVSGGVATAAVSARDAVIRPQPATAVAAPSSLPDIVADARADAMPAREARSNRRRIAAAALVALLLGIAAAATLWPRKTAPPAPASAQPALVVLPLRPIGTEHDEALLAEGLSEELITRLSRIEGLRLISSTSAMLAQSSKFDPKQLADKLNVTHALDGSLRESGNQLRINLRLIEVPSGKTLWAQDYDRSLVDRLTLESDIAQAVASALALRLGVVAGPAAAPADADPELLREWLEVRSAYLYPDKDPESMARALLARHPDYAPAHGLLAMILTRESSSADARRREEAQREAELTIRLEPTFAGAYAALARCASPDADWERAIAMYGKALQLSPTETAFRSLYGVMLSGLGYLDEGMRQAEIGVAADPLSAAAAIGLVRLLDTTGRHDEAKRRNDAFGAALTTGTRGAYYRWFNAAWRHDPADMHAALETMSPDDPWIASYTATTAAFDDPQLWPQAEAAIDEDEQRAREKDPASAGNFLRLLTPDPDYEKAFAAFSRALRANFPSYYLMVWMPEYRAARQTRAFQDYIRSNRILDYWRVHGFPPQCRPDGDGAHCD